MSPGPAAVPAEPAVQIDPMTFQPTVDLASAFGPPQRRTAPATDPIGAAAGALRPASSGESPAPAMPDRLDPVPPAKGYGRLPLVVAALAVLLVIGAVTGAVLLRSSDRPGGADPATETVAQPAGDEGGPLDNGGRPTGTDPWLTNTGPTTETGATGTETGPATTTTETGYPASEPTATPGTEAEALAELDRIRLQDLAAISFESQFVAQIASKYPGIEDPLQKAADGSHIFQASDVLAEHRRLRSQHAATEHPVILLKSTDYGKRQLVDGRALWITLVTGDFPDKQSVLDWCATHFGHLPSDELKNHCDSRNLRPTA
ncbi:hypothetical protein Ait01nite_073800 [Actinoplanes italicus]|nr:hypothetical protein Ait01nite_073800 [Actinoplanes italicus]